jgi:Outer membrane protein beta-barrel domain
MNKIKTLCLLFLLPLSIVAFGQRSKSKKSTKIVQFGASLGLDYARWRFEYADWEDNGLADQLNSLSTSKGVGLTLGGQANVLMNEAWTVRVQPQVSFSQKQMVFNLKNDKTKAFDHQLTGVELPVDLIYRFFSQKVSPCIIFGGWWRTNLNADRVPEIKLSRSDMGMNLGFGVEIDRRKYVIRPEVLVSVALKNGLQSEAVFTNTKSVEAIYRDRVSLRISVLK